MTKLKIENVVFCEHIRAEMGGKHALLGAYSPELNIAELPANIPMGIWISGTPTAIGQFEGEFRALAPDKTKLMGAQIIGEFKVLEKTSIVIGNFLISIPIAGDYIFEWKLGNKWERIAMLRIRHVPIAAGTIPSSGPRPPS